MDMTDNELLRRFEAGDEAAFAELVTRHGGLVYAAAIRQVGEPTSAEDVVQGVFLLLANKAGRINGEMLAGWLVKATVLACKAALRAERTRRNHEERAMVRRANPERNQTEEEAAWREMQGILDVAMARLGRADRTAVALRVLEGRNLRQVAEMMGISEAAAGKRVQRALVKLRKRLGKPGAALAAGAIGMIVTERSAVAIPAALAARTAARIGGGHALEIAQATGKVMFMVKVKVAVVAAGLAAVGVAMAISATRVGAAPAPSGVRQSYRGLVVDAQGKAVGGANYRVYRGNYFDPIEEASGVSTNDGMFVVGATEGDSKWVVFDVPGYAWTWWQVERSGERVTILKGGEVTGVVTDETGAGVKGAVVEAEVELPDREPWEFTGKMGVVTNDAGRFVINRLPADGRIQWTVKHAGMETYRMAEVYEGYPVRVGMKNVEISMRAGAALSIQLTEGGQPARRPGVVVDAQRGRGIIDHGTTDADGRLVLDGLGEGTWRLTGQSFGERLVTGTTELELKKGEKKTVAIEAGAGMELTGVLRDARNGKGVPDAAVHIEAAGRAGGQDLVTGADGRFSVKVVQGKYRVVTTGWEGQVKQYSKEVEVGSAGAKVEMYVVPRERVRGQLVDETGKGVEGSLRLGWCGEIKSDGEGRFVLGRWPAEAMSLGDGDLVVATSASGKLGRGFRMPLQGGDVQVILAPIGEVRGQTVDGGGKGVAVAVELRMEEGEGVSTSSNAPWSLIRDGSGGFHFSPVPVGVDTVVGVAGDPGHRVQQLRAGEVRDLGAVVVSAAASQVHDGMVSGRVIDEAGKPLVGARVSANSGLRLAMDETDLLGHFEIHGLPRDAQVEVKAEGPQRRTGGAAVTVGVTDAEVRAYPPAYSWMGKSAPPLAAEKWLQGGTPSWEALRGKVVVLQVGATTLVGDDVREQLRDVEHAYGPRGVVVMTLHGRMLANDDRIIAYLKKFDVDWAYGIDAVAKTGSANETVDQGKGAMELALGRGLFVIDQYGVLRGAPGGARGELEDLLKLLLKK